MSTKTYMTIGAIVALVFGVGFLVMPSMVMGMYGVASTAELTVAYRYFGVALVTVFALAWPLRSIEDLAVLRPLLMGHAAADLVGLAVSIWAVTSGALNALGWLNALVYASLLAGSIVCLRAPARRPFAAA